MPKTKQDVIDIVEIQKGSAEFHLIGMTPLIYNAMSFKTKGELLFPSGRKSAGQRATSLKHEPLKEYRDSTYRRRATDEGPTRLQLPAVMFKAAMADVAKRVPGGATTAEMKQLLWVENAYVDLYGVPELFMAVVRNSDMKRTPDIRTRAIVPRWYAKIVVTFVLPQLSSTTCGRLLAAAGVLNGVGDFRQQRGAGNFGQFDIVNKDDPRIAQIVESGGMLAQDTALENPVCHDQETLELFSWFEEQMSKRDYPTRAGDGVDVEEVPEGLANGLTEVFEDDGRVAA